MDSQATIGLMNIDRKSLILRRLGVSCFLLLLAFPVVGVAEDDFLLTEAQAVRKAADQVAPAVVRVELVGVAESTGEVAADASTVGTVVDPDGWIVASSLVGDRPSASILIVSADGTRQTAKIVAKDLHREWVLLKTEPKEPMAAVKLPTSIDPTVGQYTVAVGRVEGAAEPAISVGILSAVGRLRGRALQTDARVSPVYYGGPLVDIRGNLLGILVPAMPAAAGADEKSGWYDSGIAFAIPADVIAARLEKMKAGEDVQAGLLGIVSGASDPFVLGTKIDAVRPRSPAARAGFLPNDEILEINGTPVKYQYQVRQEMGRFDAGESVSFKVRREDKTVDLQTELTDSIPPLEMQAWGVYVKESEGEIEVVAIEPDSKAAAADLAPGDRLLQLAGQPIRSIDALRNQVAIADPEGGLELTYRRGESEMTATLGTQPVAGMLSKLPEQEKAKEAGSGEQKPAEWSVSELTLTDAANSISYFSPTDLEKTPVEGLLIVLLDPGKKESEEGLEKWKSAAKKYDVAVAVVASASEQRWTPAEAQDIGRAAAQLGKQLNLTRNAIGVSGDSQGPSFAMALVVAITQKEAVSGVATTTDIKPPAIRLRENDPESSLQIALPLTVKAELPPWAGGLPRLGFPIVRISDLTPSSVLHWVRTLSRI
ncbi:Periplasmic serine endoprotease DegP precursor [Roseimaritima multifibrata]|uniref:Periplasmic serine endoprotease DegP n=2 Tax=Roseimaritima multifibrata TaxID=1930274 RepID=A0A517MBN6_9BACT|nr:Periplasmic serine endoprotease DegP precursor [Roseimaritima multifibrata]